MVVERKSVPSKYFTPDGQEKNHLMVWKKAHGNLPDDPSVHQCVAAYCSDFQLLNAALVPFDLHRFSTRRIQSIKMVLNSNLTLDDKS